MAALAEPPWRRLSACAHGSVAVETALVAPVLVTLLLGVLTLSETTSVSGKVSLAASSIADLVTQATSVDDTALAGIVTAGQQILYPNAAGPDVFGGRVLCVRFQGTAPALQPTIQWEYDFGTDPGTMPPLDQLTPVAQSGVDVIYVAVDYSYKPSFGNPFFDHLTLSDTAVARPRLAETVTRN